jgi:RNA:NAD 2'-phosphotransferase (TPT1/KptA family)
MPKLTKLSKFLSLMLRHRAIDFGLTLDSEGFAETDAVWAQVQKRYPGAYTYQTNGASLKCSQRVNKAKNTDDNRFRWLELAEITIMNT